MTPKCIYIIELCWHAETQDFLFYLMRISLCKLTHQTKWKMHEWIGPHHHNPTEHHKWHKTKNGWPSMTLAIHTHKATWEQWIHVLQPQNCLAAVIQNLQQKGEYYPGRAEGRALGVVGKQQLFFRGVGTQEGIYHSNTEVSWEY